MQCSGRRRTACEWVELNVSWRAEGLKGWRGAAGRVRCGPLHAQPVLCWAMAGWCDALRGLGGIATVGACLGTEARAGLGVLGTGPDPLPLDTSPGE